MIVTRTPLRVSLFGGGTDLGAYYEEHEGAVLSLTIERSVSVIVRSRYDGDLVVNHERQERARDAAGIEHCIVREALRVAGVTSGADVTCLTDVPPGGTGLGSSSALTVGLLNALFAYRGEPRNARELAELACRIEIEVLGEPIGKQDQYAAAFGGCREYRFHRDGAVSVDRVALSSEVELALSHHVALYDTGRTRLAASVLADQRANVPRTTHHLHALKEAVGPGRRALMEGDMEALGRLLHRCWAHKKRLSAKIHDDELDRIYERALGAGAYGGKLLGAGGGGFFLFVCPPGRRDELRTALGEMRELPFQLEPRGSRVVLGLPDRT